MSAHLAAKINLTACQLQGSSMSLLRSIIPVFDFKMLYVQLLFLFAFHSPGTAPPPHKKKKQVKSCSWRTKAILRPPHLLQVQRLNEA